MSPSKTAGTNERTRRVLLTNTSFEAADVVFADTGHRLPGLRRSVSAQWLAFEQVPTVLPVWEYLAKMFRREGHNVATGKLCAEQPALRPCQRARRGSGAASASG
jgi:Rad3-related DNA helicase